MEIQKILIIGEYTPFAKLHIHYSGTKGINLAKGFCEHCNSVNMISRLIDEKRDGIQFIPLRKISIDFLNSFDLILFTRELLIKSILKNNQEFEKYIFNYPDRKAILACRMGSSSWMGQSQWGMKKLYNSFDFHFPQTDSFSNEMKIKCNRDPDNKIYSSPMAVPMVLPAKGNQPFKKYEYICCCG